MPRKQKSETQKEKDRQMRKTETPEERFVRIAKPRLQKTLKILHMVQSMVANKQYGVTQETIDIINNALTNEIERFNSSFKARTATRMKEEIEVNL